MEALLALIPIAIDLISGIFAKSESDELAAEIAKKKVTEPPAMAQAEAEAKRLSAMGMPGYETYKEEIGEMMPRTITQFKEVAQGGASVIDLAAKTLRETNKAYRDLATQEAAAKISNIRGYEGFLERKAGMQMGIQEQNIGIDIAALMQEAQGTKDLLQSFQEAGATGVSTFGMIKKLGYEKEYMDYLKGYYGPTDEKLAAPQFGDEDWFKKWMKSGGRELGYEELFG